MIIQISSIAEFMNAISDPKPKILEIQTSLLFPFTVTLPPNVSIRGIDLNKAILSFNSGDGLALTKNNEISNVTIQTNPNFRAIYTLSVESDLGVFKLSRLKVTGQIQILTRGSTKKTKLLIDEVDVVACDARKYSEQPQKYGVNVYQGALTIYNYNSDPESLIQATLTNISLGKTGAPVIGSGLFISGFSDEGGKVEVDLLTTNEIYSNGMIPYGTPNMITAGVFIVYGAHVKKIEHHGSITTHGVNDMVLDAWGRVDSWIAEKPITSYGPSGIGFVNFGIVNNFEAKDKVETFGLGARGFNQYDGTVGHAIFHSITTHGDGSIGIQVSKPVDTIEVRGPVTTYGSIGQTLVKGVIMILPANGVSIKSGGEIKKLILSGGIETHGDQVTSLEIEGKILDLNLKNGVTSNGKESVGVKFSKGGQSPLSHLSVLSKHGIAVQISKESIIMNKEGLILNGSKGNIIED